MLEPRTGLRALASRSVLLIVLFLGIIIVINSSIIVGIVLSIGTVIDRSSSKVRAGELVGVVVGNGRRLRESLRSCPGARIV